MQQTPSSLATATGKIDFPFTNDFVFRAILQRNKRVLTALICAILHIPKEHVKDIIITNPIELGLAPVQKEFILDIRVLFNNEQLIDLEMQMANFHDWPERSLSYAARCFDNLDSGEDYLDVLPVHSIGFLNFTLFDDAPEFFATYQLRNNKNNRLYTGKFSIHVIDLTRIDLATEEDKYYEIDRWAKLFKAATWEELKMIAKNDPDLMQASDELYKVNKDDILRQQARARADAEFWEKVHNARMEKMQEELSKKDAIISEKENVILEKENVILEKDSVILEKDSVISEKDNEIKRLKEQLAQKS